MSTLETFRIKKTRFYLKIVVLVLFSLGATNVALASENANYIEDYSGPIITSDQKDIATTFFSPGATNADSTASYLAKVRPNRGPNDNWQGFLCTSPSDSKCVTSSYKWEYQSLYPKCESEKDSDCIVEFWTYDESGNKFFGVLDKYLNYGNEFQGNPELKIPSGFGTSIWKFPTFKEQEAVTFALQVGEHGGEWAESLTNSAGKLGSPYDFFARIQPVQLSQIDFQPWEAAAQTVIQPDGSLAVGFGKAQEKCMGFEKSTCGVRQTFKPGQRFGITFRVSNQLRPFFRGRLNLPNLIVQLRKDGTHEVTIEALPAAIPIMEGRTRYSNIIENFPACELFPYVEWKTASAFLERWNSLVWGGGDSGDPSFAMYNCWNKWLDQQSPGELTRWTMISTSLNVNPDLARCSQNSPLALLAATNATVYSAGPPSWDSSSQTLQYKVAGPHLRSIGSLNQGNYSLILNTEVAKCLYQSQSNLFQATVEVVSDQGNQITTTTSLNTSNGYLNLTAQNFTFSSPTIRIRLLPEKQTQVNNTSKVSSQAAISNSSIATSSSKNGMKTIICLKGKTTKKVTSLSPACPKGYIKK